MDFNHLASAASNAAGNATQEICLFWGTWQIQEWWSCMSKSEWSAWVQAIFSVIAIFVAIAVPWCQRRLDVLNERRSRFKESDLTIRFYTQLLDDNNSFLKVAIEHIPERGGNTRPNSASEVASSIQALSAVPFEDIKVISFSDFSLAQALADFHCALETLKGVLSRVGTDKLSWHAPTYKYHLDKLEKICQRIAANTQKSSLEAH